MAILFFNWSINEPDNKSVATRLPPAVAVPTVKSLFWFKTSLGTRIPPAGRPYFLEAASDTSLSKAAAYCACLSVGFDKACKALVKENLLTSFWSKPTSGAFCICVCSTLLSLSSL